MKVKRLVQDGTAVCQWNQYVKREMSDLKAYVLLSPAGSMPEISPTPFLKFEDRYEGGLASKTQEL